MGEFGLTPSGPNIKRLDQIVDSLHTKLSRKWGVNTRQNPESLLNHLLVNFADEAAELWEFGEDIYYSEYPSSAEGVSLDNASQYGGTTREGAAKSYYPIHCTGKDGTLLTAGTMISSTTNPATNLTLTEDKEITRTAFNEAVIKVAALGTGDVYTVAINGAVFSYAPESANAVVILKGLAKAITSQALSVNVNEDDELLEIRAIDQTSTNTLILSPNLTTETVTSILTFGTVDTGDILLPEGVITNIVKADAGLLAVANRCGYIAGRDQETDAELRKSYADKIFNRSSRMLESIRSAILQNVQGVTSVAPYENDSNEWDSQGRPPHSIEIVVDGGDSREIAEQILEKKTGGINTFGNVSVVIPGEYGEDITIRFNRPTVVHVWFHLGLTLSKTETLPANYVDLLRKAIVEEMAAQDTGKDVIPQQFEANLHKVCPGITYIDIRLFATEESTEPTEYPSRSATITARQRAYTTEEMIEVEIDG